MWFSGQVFARTFTADTVITGAKSLLYRGCHMKICITCKQAKPATTEFFNRASRWIDGLHCYCRECSTARQRRKNHEKMMARPEYVEALNRKQRGVRQCTKCKVEKPATNEFFHAYKRAPDGCREVCRICRAADHAEHRDERLPKRRNHYVKNRERLNATSRIRGKAHYEKNKEQYYRRYHERRARKASSCGSLSFGIRKRLFAEQAGKCVYCATGLGRSAHLDHIVPLAKGGTNTDDNVQLLCQFCNLSKGAKMPDEFLKYRNELLAMGITP